MCCTFIRSKCVPCWSWRVDVHVDLCPVFGHVCVASVSGTCRCLCAYAANDCDLDCGLCVVLLFMMCFGSSFRVCFFQCGFCVDVCVCRSLGRSCVFM